MKKPKSSHMQASIVYIIYIRGIIKYSNFIIPLNILQTSYWGLSSVK